MEDVEIVVTALYDALDRQGITKARFLGPDNHDCVTVYHTPNIDLTERPLSNFAVALHEAQPMSELTLAARGAR